MPTHQEHGSQAASAVARVAAAVALTGHRVAVDSWEFRVPGLTAAALAEATGAAAEAVLALLVAAAAIAAVTAAATAELGGAAAAAVEVAYAVLHQSQHRKKVAATHGLAAKREAAQQ